MTRALPRYMALGTVLLGAATTIFFLVKSYQAYQQVSFAAQEAYFDSLRETASTKAVALISLDEVFANVNSGTDENRKMHTLGIKLELELFEEKSRDMIEQRLGGIKNAIIATALEQDYDSLSTIAGKLFYKESLVAQINAFFNKAVIRDIHFSSFYLQ